MVNFSLEGKVALVTGASYGIGFAIATAFAEAGAKIAFNDIKQELVDKGLASYKEKGIEAKGYVCDVTKEDQVAELVKKIENDLGPINILVNNAGIIKRIPMCDMKAEQDLPPALSTQERHKPHRWKYDRTAFLPNLSAPKTHGRPEAESRCPGHLS